MFLQHCCIYGILFLKLHMIKINKTSMLWDNCGIGVSLLCSIHCALMPILIITSAIVGMHIEALEKIETPLFITAAIIGSISIFQTYFKLKKSKPALLLILGLMLILLGGIVEGLWFESTLRVCGSLIIVSAHFTNKKVVKQFSV
ncbi:MerC domain-containing protein [Peijinzhouia sedimentorum]